MNGMLEREPEPKFWSGVYDLNCSNKVAEKKKNGQIVHSKLWLEKQLMDNDNDTSDNNTNNRLFMTTWVHFDFGQMSSKPWHKSNDTKIGKGFSMWDSENINQQILRMDGLWIGNEKLSLLSFLACVSKSDLLETDFLFTYFLLDLKLTSKVWLAQ